MTFRSVGQLGRDAQLALATDFHAGYTLIPSLDDVALPDREIEGLMRVDRTVELLARGKATRCSAPFT
jgi:hypothetical protein